MIIATDMQKGGVGKTTTTLALGSELARSGARVLVVDTDPQGSATTGSGVVLGEADTERVALPDLDTDEQAV